MTAPFTTDQIQAIAQESARVVFLVKVVNSHATYPFTWLYCTGSTKQVYDSDVYEPRAISGSATGRGSAEIAHMTIEIDNRDEVLGAQIAPTTGLCESACTVVMMTAGDSGPFSDPIILISGGIVRASIGDDISFEVSPLLGQRRSAALMKMLRTCGYTFGEELCGYDVTAVGADQYCNHTFYDCDTNKSNSDRFGGARFAPLPDDSISVDSGFIIIRGSRINWYQTKPWNTTPGTDLPGHGPIVPTSGQIVDSNLITEPPNISDM